MELYTQAASPANMLWPEPLETVWNVLTPGPGVPGSKMPHVSLAEQLFVAAVVNTPRPTRPWGAIKWPEEQFQISRPSIYDLGKRAGRRLVRGAGGPARQSASRRRTGGRAQS